MSRHETGRRVFLLLVVLQLRPPSGETGDDQGGVDDAGGGQVVPVGVVVTGDETEGDQTVLVVDDIGEVYDDRLALEVLTRFP